MCIGIPMQVISCEQQSALCDDQGKHQQVDISLVGTQAPGTWLMVFLGAAREVMCAEEARKTLDAIKAVQQVMQGSEQIDYLFADLIDREPQLPEHLRAAAQTAANQTTSNE